MKKKLFTLKDLDPPKAVFGDRGYWLRWGKLSIAKQEEIAEKIADVIKWIKSLGRKYKINFTFTFPEKNFVEVYAGDQKVGWFGYRQSGRRRVYKVCDFRKLLKLLEPYLLDELTKKMIL